MFSLRPQKSSKSTFVTGALIVLFSSISEAETIHASRFHQCSVDFFIEWLFAVNMGLGVTLMWQHWPRRAS